MQKKLFVLILIFFALVERRKGNAQQCTGFQCNDNITCIPASWECDSWADCPDVSDEHKNCPPCDGIKCPESGWCIPKSWVCDGEVDCTVSKADEQFCQPIVPQE